MTQKQYATRWDPKMYPHTKFGILASNNKGYAPETIFLKMGTEVKATVTQKQYVALCAYKVYPHTKLGIPTLNNTGDMLRYIFSRTEARGQGQGHSDLETVCDTLQLQDLSTH